MRKTYLKFLREHQEYSDDFYRGITIMACRDLEGYHQGLEGSKNNIPNFLAEDDHFFKKMPLSPFNKIMEALCFEKHELFMDAINSFEDAIRLVPNVVEYKWFEDAFFRRNQF